MKDFEEKILKDTSNDDDTITGDEVLDFLLFWWRF